MHDAYDFSFQRKGEKLILQRLQIIFLLAGGNNMYQNLTGSHSPPEQKMSEITCVLHLFIIGSIQLQKIFVDTGEDFCHILMNQLTI